MTDTNKRAKQREDKVKNTRIRMKLGEIRREERETVKNGNVSKREEQNGERR